MRAERVIEKTRIEQRQRINAELVEREAFVEERRPDRDAKWAVVDKLQREYVEWEERYGRKAPAPPLQAEIADARRAWHAVEREIKQAERRIEELGVELEQLVMLGDALLVAEAVAGTDAEAALDAQSLGTDAEAELAMGMP